MGLQLCLHVYTIRLFDAIRFSFWAVANGLCIDAIGNSVGVVLVVDTLESDQLRTVDRDVEVIVLLHPVHGEEHNVLSRGKADLQVEVL